MYVPFYCTRLVRQIANISDIDKWLICCIMNIYHRLLSTAAPKTWNFMIFYFRSVKGLEFTQSKILGSGNSAKA